MKCISTSTTKGGYGAHVQAFKRRMGYGYKETISALKTLYYFKNSCVTI